MYSALPVLPLQPLPPAMIATPMPDTAGTLRVPPTDVAPSFSNEQVSNESRGTKNPAARVVSNQPPTQGTQGAFTESPNPAPQLQSNAQTNFLAQLISQDISPQATIYLAEYQKLVYFSNVKYKPSNAGKPAPAGLFEKLLKADAPNPSAPILLQAVPAQVARIGNAGIAADVSDDDGYEEPQAYTQPAIYVPDAALLSERASKAYTATSARNEALLETPKNKPADQPA